jgi:hypothetical protein
LLDDEPVEVVANFARLETERLDLPEHFVVLGLAVILRLGAARGGIGCAEVHADLRLDPRVLQQFVEVLLEFFERVGRLFFAHGWAGFGAWDRSKQAPVASRNVLAFRLTQ